MRSSSIVIRRFTAIPDPALIRHVGHSKYEHATVVSTTVTHTISGANIAVGTHLIAGIALTGNPPVAGTPTLTDSKGNTWAINVNGDSTSENGSAAALIGSAKITTALVAGDTITFTLSTGRLALLMSIDQFSDLATSSWFDASAHNMTVSGSPNGSWTVGPTGTLTKQPSLVYAVACISSGAGDWITAPVGLTRTAFDTTTAAPSDREIMTMYKTVFSTAAVTVSGTLSSTAWGGVVGTFKGA